MNLRFALSLLACSQPLAAQRVSIGAKVGGHVTDWVYTPGGRTFVRDVGKRFTVGPYAEVRLIGGLSVEVDALYRRYGYISQGGISGAFGTADARTGSWEFPILARYRLWGGPLRPFLLAGPTFRHVPSHTLVSVCEGSLCGSQTGRSQTRVDGFTTRGASIGGGLEAKLSRLRLSGEMRYQRFGEDQTLFPPFHRNQAVLLFGIGF